MRRRDTVREAAEQAVRQKLGRQWRTAKEIAQELRLPWRVVARTLKRMAARGDIEMDERINVAARCRVRRRPCYRAMNAMAPVGPTWFMAAAGFQL